MSSRAGSAAANASGVVGAVGVGAALVWALVEMPTPGVRLAPDIAAYAGELINPVTAVLLDFRGYDTLLEVTVLMVALLSAHATGAHREHAHPALAPVLDAVITRMAAPAIVLAGYLLWAGATRPGGAFQAGAILAGLGVLLWLGRRWLPAPQPGIGERMAGVLGPLVFCSVAAVLVPLGGHLLDYPAAATGELTLLIETAVLISVAITLAALFVMAG